ncbi:MAG: hypothetical protein AMXMBFR53_41850 [Gemmatimonadota bacterium]
MADEHDILSEEEALRLWQKAAQLQAEAARRAEAQASREASADLGEGDARPAGDGYALVHVRAAALEAGISEEFVEAALAEVRAQRAMEGVLPRPRRLSRLLLGRPADAVEARRVVLATPQGVLEAMEELFPNEPYTLLLRDRQGDPLRGGTLVFDLQGVGFTTAGQGGFKGDASYADLRQVFATLTPLPGDPPRTEVTLRSPVAWAMPLNAGIATAMSGFAGAMGFAGGAGLVSIVGLAGPLAAILAATGAGAGVTLAMGGFRSLYRYAMGRGTRGLEGLLTALAARAEGGWGIAPRKE